MTTQKTIVLVHGGRHGAWCWGRVTPLLSCAGYDVHVPTLTGLGEKAGMLTPEVGLSTHAADVVDSCESKDLSDVVLVAHSYAGSVVAEAMRTIYGRVARLILIDAFLPRTGENALDIVGHELAAAVANSVKAVGEGWYLPVTDASFYGVTDPDDAAWVNRQLTPQPFKTYTDRVGDVTHFWSAPGVFVECNPTTIQPLIRQRAKERSIRDTAFTYRFLDAPHDAMVSAPSLVSDLIVEFAAD